MAFDDINPNVEDVKTRQALQRLASTWNTISPTASADGMFKNPESDTEAGYLTVTIDGTDYQIPLYASS